ncbi:MAG: DUF4087 domain-containing protein [Paracoccus sp. (in: a-proteobacteria)]|nr:DUF4087 domain-containing protein [Paracoccus sp. (in: a-proteobacteria)]
MRLFTLALLPLALMATPVLAAQQCGWWSNPSAGNEYLINEEGVWVLLEQGRDDEPMDYALLDEMDISAGLEGVQTGTGYGYSCACLDFEADAENRVTRILSPGKSQPLATCAETLEDLRPEG